MGSGTFTVALIGGGGIVRSHHLPGLRAVPGVVVHGVAGRDAARSREFASQLGLAIAYPDWQEAIADAEVDAVVIGTWPDTHEAMTVAALEAGKHVLCEARMAADHAGALRMLAAAQRRPDLTLMIVPAALTFWCDRTVERLLAQGSIGPIRSVRVEWGGDRPLRPHAWWRRVRATSGDNIMELGILLESIARWVGHPERVAAEARLIDDRLSDGPADMRADVPDHLRVIGELPNSASLGLTITSLETPEVLGRRVVLTGPDGVLEIDLREQRIVLDDGAARLDVVPEPGEAREWTTEQDFCEGARNGTAITHTAPATAERYMAVTTAVRRAYETGTSITVPSRTDLRTHA